MPDTNYGPKVYRKQGGDELVVASGGAVTVESGGTFTLPGDRGKGCIQIPFAALREIASNDIPATAADAGVLAKDTTPNFERENGATDKALRLEWAATNVDEVTFHFAYPPDLDDAQPVTVHAMAKMAGATDTPVLAVGYFEGIGDTNAGGNSAALSSTLAEVSVTIAAADIGAHPNFASVSITPGAHGTDALYLYALWIEYTKKSS